MTADRRSSKHSLLQAVSLLAALAVALSARPLAAAPQMDAFTPTPLAPFTVPVSTRIIGELRSVAGDTWQVDDITVKLSPATTIFQTKGAVQPGAWVRVSGTKYETYLAAEVVDVVRPAGSTPVYELTGALGKQGGTFWFIGDSHVLVTDATKKVGTLVTGGLVRARCVAKVRRSRRSKSRPWRRIPKVCRWRSKASLSRSTTPPGSLTITLSWCPHYRTLA